MSERNWTPEPWHVVLSDNATPFVQHECGYDYTDIQDKSSMVCQMPVEIRGSFNSLVNAKRIVSCVNACAGSPASIQPGAVVAMAEALESAIIAMEDYEERIDCEWGNWRCIEQIEKDGELPEEITQARAALALYNGTGVE